MDKIYGSQLILDYSVGRKFKEDVLFESVEYGISLIQTNFVVY